MTAVLSTKTREQLQNQAIQSDLLARVTAENAVLMEALDAFYAVSPHDKESYVALGQAVIAALDRILGDDDWSDSLFLRNTAKPLYELRAQMSELLSNASVQLESRGYALPAVTDDVMPVYILLYQSEGHLIQKWAQLLKTLDSYALGRPAYANEAEVQKIIRMKCSEGQDAYVKVAVARAFVQTDTMFSQRIDRYGNKLLSLPATAVSPHHILEFVHAGKRYHFIKGKLIDVSSTTKCH